LDTLRRRQQSIGASSYITIGLSVEAIQINAQSKQDSELIGLKDNAKQMHSCGQT